jgi:dTDP-4-dehydrorhamnose reductase
LIGLAAMTCRSAPAGLSSTKMKLLITGAGGLIGCHLARRLAWDHDVAALKHSDLDITDRAAVDRIVADLRPAIIFNCAVLQVDESEQKPAKAAAVNADGPGFLAQAAHRIGAEIVHFSTQYAFSGEPRGRAAYIVDDEPQPVNVYGNTKVAGELAVRRANGRSYIIRTSWVYGSGKDSFLCVAYDALAAGRRIQAIDDIWSSTTYVEDLIDRCLEIVERRHYATYHVVNDGVCSYYDFALEAARLAGLTRQQADTLIEVKHERDMKRSALRPRYTPLRCLVSERLGFPPMRHWRDALRAFASERMSQQKAGAKAPPWDSRHC